MNLSPFYRRLAALLLGVSVSLLSAAETAAPKPTPATPPAAAAPATPATETVGSVVDLPVLQVRESRILELDKIIAKLDKQIARERKKMKSSELDKTLNSTKLSNAAAIFGGNSAEHLAAIATFRVSLLESERLVLEGMKHPHTQKELDDMNIELDLLRTNRRNLDNVQAQR